jgi:predicted MFS family arabinose efflux permease
VVEFVNWRWIFIAQVPLTLITIAVCAVVFPDTPRDRSTRFDVIGAILLALGSGGFVVALNRAPEAGWGWTHPLVLVGFVSAPVLLTSFVLYERRIQNQLIPLHYFRRRNFSFAMVNQFFANFAYMGGFFLTPVLLVSVLQYSPSKIVVVSIVRPLAFAVMGPLAGWAATKVGERVNAVAGGTFLLLSMLVFSTVTHDSGELVVLVALLFSGIGMGSTAPAMAAAVANAVDDTDLGVAGGTQQMISQLGVVVGTQILITVQTSTATTGASDASSYAKGYLVGGVAAILGITAATFIRSTIVRTRAQVAAEPLDAPGALVYAEAL